MVSRRERLPPAKEFVIVQSEFYLAEAANRVRAFDYAQMTAMLPDFVAFNGRPNQYIDAPIRVRVGDRVRLWVASAGPTHPSHFHVVGEQFDTVYLSEPSGTPIRGVQTFTVLAGGTTTISSRDAPELRMSDTPAPLGRISWVDLTVPNAAALQKFYSKVTGWTAMPLSLGEYDDYLMLDADGAPQAGVCHARGANSGTPPQWIVYITVSGLDEKLREVEALGGKIVMPTRSMGTTGRYALIEDPAGAVCALFETA